MGKKILLVIALAIVVAACAGRSGAERAREMASAYAELNERYDLLNDQLNEKMKRSGAAQEADKFIGEHERIMSAKKREMEKLLEKYESGAGNDSLNLVRSKVMIEIGRFDEAEKIIDRLTTGETATAAEATLQKAALHLMHRRYAEAVKLVREIEAAGSQDSQFYNLCLILAFSHPDLETREEFSRQLIEAPLLPDRIKPLTARLHANLALLAKERNQPIVAMNYWDKALALENDPELKSAWEKDRKQLAMFNQPPPPLVADNWLDGKALSLPELKGKVVVIDFWAPWCAPCHQVIPVLQEQHRRRRDKGLVVIGYTRLYGRYGDELERREKVTATEELALIQKYIARNKITYPIAVDTEGAAFAAYSVTAIPTMVFIDRRGNIAYFKTGSGSPEQIEKKIEALLAEK